MRDMNVIDESKGMLGFKFCLCLVAVSLMAACASDSKELNQPSETFLHKIKNASITVYPTIVTHGIGAFSYDENSSARLGEFVTTDSNAQATISSQRLHFVALRDERHQGTWHEGADAIRSHISKHPIDTDYAILAVYRISNTFGVRTIYCYLADAQANLVRWFQIDSSHQVFIEGQPQDAADCTRLLIQVLHERVQRMDLYGSVESTEDRYTKLEIRERSDRRHI